MFFYQNFNTTFGIYFHTQLPGWGTRGGFNLFLWIQRGNFTACLLL